MTWSPASNGGTLSTGIAQLVEHWSPKPGVGSSSLSSRAIKKYKMQSIITSFKNSYEELVHKTTWPSRKELMSSAVVVLIASLCIALVVFAMDSVFQTVMGSIYELLH